MSKIGRHMMLLGVLIVVTQAVIDGLTQLLPATVPDTVVLGAALFIVGLSVTLWMRAPQQPK